MIFINESKIHIWNNLSEIDKRNMLLRPAVTYSKKIIFKIKQIISQVQLQGDKSLYELTEKFDLAKLNNLQVSPFELKTAFEKVDNKIIQAIEFAKKQLETNQKFQLPENKLVQTCEGVICERQFRPIESVGLYIPGGSAPLISTVIMLAIPAKIANCPTKIICTPPNATGEVNPNILVAAQLCGINTIYKIGGAQAIAAMAYGTETVPKVVKIFGPGNNWVTQSKLLVSQDPYGASIDMPAGPSEVMVIADESANPDFVAADLLSQAEHGADSQVILVTLSKKVATEVLSSIEQQRDKLPRNRIISQSLKHSRIIIAESISQAISISNMYAPEHLILQIENPELYKSQIYNAGAVFLGKWSPETVGDYVTGSNHVLPTFGYAKCYSGLSVYDFGKFVNFQYVSQHGLKLIGPHAEKLAEVEQLLGHKQAVTLRLKNKVML